MQVILNCSNIAVNQDLLTLTLYGYGVYTSFISENLQVLGLELHLQRIINDAEQFLGLKLEQQQVLANLRKHLVTYDANKAGVYRVTIFPQGLDINQPQNITQPNILITKRDISAIKPSAMSLTTIAYHRDFPQYKSTNIGATMMTRAKAKQAGYDDALFCHHGIIAEGPTWNIFFVDNDEVVTPDIPSKILPGVTRRILIEHMGLKIREEQIMMTDLSKFNAAFITNSVLGIIPVMKINSINYSLDNTMVKGIIDQYYTLKQDSLF
jgi:4-amino-4-deoxychorismate lyase